MVLECCSVTREAWERGSGDCSTFPCSVRLLIMNGCCRTFLAGIHVLPKHSSLHSDKLSGVDIWEEQ